MQPTGINPSLVRFLMTTAPDLMTELFTPGRVLEADVVSVFQDKAVLSFGRGMRLEVTLQAPLQEGQRVRVQVQARDGASQPGQQPRAPMPGETAPPGGAPILQGLPKPTPGVPAQAQPQPQPWAPAQTQAQPQPQSGAPAQAQAQPQPQPGAPAQAQPQPGAPAQAQPQPQPGVPAQAQPQPQSGAPAQAQPQPQPQPGAPARAQPQPQPAAPAQAQPKPQPGAPTQAQPQAAPAPIILKIIGPAPPRSDAARPVAPQQPGQTQAQPGAPAQAQPQPGTPTQSATRATSATPAPFINETAAPVSNQPAAPQPGAPQVLWLPIPLPDGNQGWAQIHVQEDDSPKTRAQKGGPVQQVRIWWETPALGPVQVTMEAGAANLAALFTAAAADSKGALDQSLHELQRRLAQVGFPEARVGCRTAAPGETVEPARTLGASRLDKRL